MSEAPPAAIHVQNLDFSYSYHSDLVLKNVSFQLPPGSRCLVIIQGYGYFAHCCDLSSLVEMEQGRALFYNFWLAYFHSVKQPVSKY